MNLTRLSSTTGNRPSGTTTAARPRAATPLVQPVDGSAGAAGDRDTGSPSFVFRPADETPQGAEHAARQARRLMAAIIRLGPRARLLIKPIPVRCHGPIDEEI